MNNRWRKQIKILKPLIKKYMEESDYCESIAVSALDDVPVYHGTVGVTKALYEANMELWKIYSRLKHIIPKNRIVEIGNQEFFCRIYRLYWRIAFRR